MFVWSASCIEKHLNAALTTLSNVMRPCAPRLCCKRENRYSLLIRHSACPYQFGISHQSLFLSARHWCKNWRAKRLNAPLTLRTVPCYALPCFACIQKSIYCCSVFTILSLMAGLLSYSCRSSLLSTKHIPPGVLHHYRKCR